MMQLSEHKHFPSHKQITGDFHGGGMCAARKATAKPRLMDCWSHLSRVCSVLWKVREACAGVFRDPLLIFMLDQLNLPRGDGSLSASELSEKIASALKAISCFEFPQQREIMSVCGHCLICHHTLHTCLEMSYLSTRVQLPWQWKVKMYLNSLNYNKCTRNLPSPWGMLIPSLIGNYCTK